MADFRTPLPAHRAAFARMAPGFDLPAAAKEELRTLFQAAERSGDPARLRRTLRDFFGQYIWHWPWFDTCAAELEAAGVWPLCWTQDGITPDTRWQAIPHNVKADLVGRALVTAAYTERDLANLRQLQRDGVSRPIGRLHLDDDRCAASRWAFARHALAVERGDFATLPPLFPGCAVSFRIDLQRGKR